MEVGFFLCIPVESDELAEGLCLGLYLCVGVLPISLRQRTFQQFPRMMREKPEEHREDSLRSVRFLCLKLSSAPSPEE